MAHTAVVRWMSYKEVARTVYVLEVTQLLAVLASEWQTVTGGETTVYGPTGSLQDVPLPQTYKVIHMQATCAVALAYKMGKASGWSPNTQNDGGTQDATPVHYNEQNPLVVTHSPGSQPVLFGRPQPQTGTQSVTTLLTIVGH